MGNRGVNRCCLSRTLRNSHHWVSSLLLSLSSSLPPAGFGRIKASRLTVVSDVCPHRDPPDPVLSLTTPLWDCHHHLTVPSPLSCYSSLVCSFGGMQQTKVLLQSRSDVCPNRDLLIPTCLLPRNYGTSDSPPSPVIARSPTKSSVCIFGWQQCPKAADAAAAATTTYPEYFHAGRCDPHHPLTTELWDPPSPRNLTTPSPLVLCHLHLLLPPACLHTTPQHLGVMTTQKGSGETVQIVSQRGPPVPHLSLTTPFWVPRPTPHKHASIMIRVIPLEMSAFSAAAMSKKRCLLLPLLIQNDSTRGTCDLHHPVTTQLWDPHHCI